MFRIYWDADMFLNETAITSVFIFNGAMTVKDKDDFVTSERNIKTNHN